MLLTLCHFRDEITPSELMHLDKLELRMPLQDIAEYAFISPPHILMGLVFGFECKGNYKQKFLREAHNRVLASLNGYGQRYNWKNDLQLMPNIQKPQKQPGSKNLQELYEMLEYDTIKTRARPPLDV
jgi:hypothetical protein